MAFQNANCLKMTVLIFYNPVLVKEAGLILSNGETPPLVQNKTKSAVNFSTLVCSRPQQRTRVT